MGPGSDGPLGAMAGMEPHHMNGSLGNTTHHNALSQHNRHVFELPARLLRISNYTPKSQYKIKNCYQGHEHFF